MPQFPTSTPDVLATPETREHKRDHVSEKHWRLVQVNYYQNLLPSQIVREMDAADHGWAEDDDHAGLAEAVDSTADSDRRRGNPARGDRRTVDERRYVVDPVAGAHTFRGLWTGGPVQHLVANGHKVLRQTLTRTWCAGHGYTVSGDGSYLAVWKDASGAWTTTPPEDYGAVHTTREQDGAQTNPPMGEGAPEVREFRTAEQALKESRPAWDGRLSPYMAFRDDIPGTFSREITWREFTHESTQALEELSQEEGRATLKRIVAYHCGRAMAEAVNDVHTRLDPQTNTVVFVVSLLWADLFEPETLDDLLELPVLDAPCSRETLRMFGWNQLRDGEGYEYVHLFRWPRLKDSEKVRNALEFVKDNAFLAEKRSDDGKTVLRPSGYFLQLLMRKHSAHLALREKPSGKADEPWWSEEQAWRSIETTYEGDGSQLDTTGRLTRTQTDPASSTQGGESYPVQYYRIAQQKFEQEQDGSLAFTILVSKAEWHGYDDGKDYESGGRRQLASVSDPQGYGVSEHRVIPSVPRENAIATMNAIKAEDPTYELIVQKAQTEGQKGSSDVSFTKARMYSYLGEEDCDTPESVKGKNPFNATSYSYDPNDNLYRLTWDRVAPDKLADLKAWAAKKLGGTPTFQEVCHPEGYYTLSVVAKGKEPVHVAEWCVEADWFQHQTLEQWLGVTVEHDSDGKPTGFYAKYKKVKDPQGNEIYDTDSAGNLKPDGDATPFAAIRGDLDAGWMGASPQNDAAGTVRVTTGVGNASEELDPQPSHGDIHVSASSGWKGGTDATAWEDPDTSSNADDKTRSHALARVSPRRNSDGTYDISITRTYPHQRYWDYVLPSETGSGDIYNSYHFAYRNWPSRKAIEADIVARIKGAIKDLEARATKDEWGGTDWEWNDGWSIQGGFSVNAFGLVDAPNLSLVPSKDNSKAKKARAKTYTTHLQQVVSTVEKSHTAPQTFRDADPVVPPQDGFWWREVKYYIYSGTTSSVSEAYSQYAKYGGPLEGSKGVQQVTRKNGIPSHWTWHVIYKIEIGEWSNGKVAYSAGQILSHGDGQSQKEADGSEKTK